MTDTILTLQRAPTYKEATFGGLSIDGTWFCHTLEDAIREIPGQPVESWKIHGKTAIPSGRYRVTLEYSPKFGADTITLQGVPGYIGVRMHGGNTVDDTDGCPIVGTTIDREAPRIAGAQISGILLALKARVRVALNRGDVWIDIVNPPEQTQ
jgi:hypothetical protein